MSKPIEINLDDNDYARFTGEGKDDYVYDFTSLTPFQHYEIKTDTNYPISVRETPTDLRVLLAGANVMIFSKNTDLIVVKDHLKVWPGK